MGTLSAANVGMPKNVSWRGRTVYTGVWKAGRRAGHGAAAQRRTATGRGDVADHGGENRAVFVYPLGCYRYWREFLGRGDFSYGQFGDSSARGGAHLSARPGREGAGVVPGLRLVGQPHATLVDCDDLAVPASAGISRRQAYQVSGQPCTSSSGGPSPPMLPAGLTDTFTSR
jgi:hypothetical protein